MNDAWGSLTSAMAQHGLELADERRRRRDEALAVNRYIARLDDVARAAWPLKDSSPELKAAFDALLLTHPGWNGGIAEE